MFSGFYKRAIYAKKQLAFIGVIAKGSIMYCLCSVFSAMSKMFSRPM